MSETVALPELILNCLVYANRWHERRHEFCSDKTITECHLIQREDQLRTAIARAELAEAKLAKRDATIAELRANLSRGLNALFGERIF